MDKSFKKMLTGYQAFREKYAVGDQSIMRELAYHGQQPEIMFVACCDSRVDPSLILQCEPGDLFIVRNVANIVPPYECDEKHHGTSAALEFGIRYLQVKHLIILGHSQCGGMRALLHSDTLQQNDFISHWVALLKDKCVSAKEEDKLAQQALSLSYQNCLSFPWIKERLEKKQLSLHLWFFDISNGEIFTFINGAYQPLSEVILRN